jgi:hypothetical protein
VRKYKGNKRILVWVAISFDGPKQLYFTEEKKNTDVYFQILGEYLPYTTRLMNGELIFMHDNSPPHFALEIRSYFTDKPFNGHPKAQNLIQSKISG